MKAIVCTSVLLAMTALMHASSFEQRAGTSQNMPLRTRYDASKEITVSGTVHSLGLGRNGQPSGTHLVISTSRGLIDAHLGSFALLGSQPVSLHQGEQVSVVGVLTTTNRSSMLLARTVRTNTQLFVIRNQHGALLFPHPGAAGKLRFRTVNREGEQQ